MFELRDYGKPARWFACQNREAQTWLCCCILRSAIGSGCIVCFGSLADGSCVIEMLLASRRLTMSALVRIPDSRRISREVRKVPGGDVTRPGQLGSSGGSGDLASCHHQA